MATVELWVIVAAVTFNELKAAVPPTAPVNVVVPAPPTVVTAAAPLTVLANVMAALFEVIVLVPVNETGSAKERGLAPLTVMLFPIWMSAPFVNTRFVGAALAPTAPFKAIVPPVPPFKVKICEPLTTLANEILAPAAVPPAFVVSIVTAAPKETLPFRATAPPLVVILLSKVINVDPP